ncbi:bifunctional 2-C-methyl-D-erythritol 4-phosphate cytidylyltransferase/2-C-methyl-D-erythritol 2,4-cyclodiphosphate synthase [Sphingobium sp. GW456-12-10-14-TSB1]|uniref:Bifunctional enzyme IspD/IspF n=1 Tax=Sphingobium xenophagum TaxID=121428 RepID=A0A249MVX5_SPHXE|nr:MULTISPECIES: bifunctional 2-C-methyl-D-erythritol 4-phosphate cytidylyltransferase/2-C-methyl-D-erythritol 2,4-cyclodiphosphate synthase [Sphingobium]ASY45442.1 bifunctional 2-C-methyl-D-erythritol 4-phosphate cytidylyltransferase/2-C-methyl-D-erythritol 2,4-cyclodiphosphate synthase [Sphingobium xenophagum]OUC54873.1 bifunctional 2-C-methyl-D-erythritol 4-phosphate cytidylyltransferase/2-C-methyl-D-erythritol 2,4-cyclodiphosphate synthase [Sphingobium sp. GW456-12-10-14-TSB1]QWT13966.1 bifu
MPRAMTDNRHRTVALLVAAGTGSRVGGDIPKQFRTIGGKAVILHAVDAMMAHGGIDAIHLVIGAGQEAQVRALLADRAIAGLTEGADSRRGSVRAGLEAIAATGGADRVLIHDAARPFVPTAVIDRLLGALDDAQGAIPVLPVADTLVRGADGAMGDGVARDGLFRVQTPQAFMFDTILAAHRCWDESREATDDAQILKEQGHDVILVAGDEGLEKLTYPQDFARAEARLVSTRTVRVGMGYDVHRLAEDEELWLGGIRVPHDRGLAGHSDADVALHAIVDALLGALAEGDIGSHFPPSDPQWRGASSDRFLAYAGDRVTERGGTIDHVDLTIICEAPKIGPHRDAMRARIGQILGLPVDRISVKATTTERLGFTGRREGIAAQAVATLSLPALS